MQKISLFICLILVSCMEAPHSSQRGTNSAERSQRDSPPPTITPKAQDILLSHISRTAGAEQKTLNQVSSGLARNILSSQNLRTIPNPSLDHTGAVIAATTPTKNCGLKEIFNSINSRINNCSQNNQKTHFWSGQDNGIAGESNWTLVAADVEWEIFIWRDEKTGLVWSHQVAQKNWNEASGFEVSSQDFICGELNIFPSDQIKWRLPTRNDFLQADIDGVAAVSIGFERDQLFWSATSSADLTKAWAITVSEGRLVEVDKKSLLGVRCVGEVLQ